MHSGSAASSPGASSSDGSIPLERDPLIDSDFDNSSEGENFVFAGLIDALHNHTAPSDPASYREAMARPDSSLWKQATLEEGQAIEESGTFEYLPMNQVPPGATVLNSKFIYKTKLDSNGNVERYKGRLVAMGFRQREGIDYDLIFAPVAHHETIRVMLAVAAQQGMHIHQMDVKNAFLAGEIDGEVYMRLPEGWPDELPGNREEHVVRLRRPLYGLKQASRCWYERLNKWMEQQGFTRSHSDPCLFFKDLGSHLLFVTVWVDDLLILCPNAADIDRFKQDIAGTFKMKDLGAVHFCLGMRIAVNAGCIMVDQERYIEGVLKRFGMDASRPVSTPFPPGTELVAAADGDFLDVDAAHLYREITGSLMYLVACTRPDLAVAVNQLARHMSKPGKAHMGAAKHCLRHLRGTAQLGLTFRKNSTSPNQLIGYADATWGSIPGSSRSVSGYAFLLNGAAVAWKCKVQKCVALSTAEAEFLSLCEATREAVFLRNMMLEIGLPQNSATTINEDNQPCIHLVRNPVTSGRSKHIALRFNFVRDQILDGNIEVVYCPTADMVADLLTKMLAKPQHCRLRAMVLGMSE